MKRKIEKLKQIKQDLSNLIELLEGDLHCRQYDGVLKNELSCYRTEGYDYQNIIDSIFQEHGDEMLPIKD
ncbi:tunnelling fold family protein [Dysgonomonas termitidis]|uniref:Uncharacterized protein n=1 Tax=Dysgonomonas termitidis TaxID=1516126 RepID=A0ABV9KTQ6_9BACT